MPACRYKFYLLVFNSISHLFPALTREISSWTLEDKIRIHVRACNILYIRNEWVTTLTFLHNRYSRNEKETGRVNFCKDFWDCYYIGTGEKSANSADRCVISNNPRNSCGTHVGSRSILFSEKANDIDCFTISEISRQLNKTVNPCEDFFSYVCGGFFKKHQLGENNSVESAFSVLFHDNMRVIRHVLRNATSIYPQVWNQVCFS